MNVDSLLDIEFSPVRLDDLTHLSDFLNRHPQPLTGYTFASLAAWKSYFRYEWAFAEPETLLISCILDADPHRHLLQPIGIVSAAMAQRIADAAANMSYPMKIVGVSDRFLKDNPFFSHSFTVREDRSVSNYIYSAGALAALSGRKYSKKRNLLAQASGLYKWSVQPITQALTESCFRVLDSIIKEENPQVEGMLAGELGALEFTLRHFDEFGQQGLLVSVGDKPAAFSIYEAINPTTIAVHFERALRSYKGLYQVINLETAKVAAAQGYEFINREEDLGNDGLRDAKMSYHPIEIAPSYELTCPKHAAGRPPTS